MAFLSLIHIFSGAFWAGSVLFVVGFLDPVVAAMGPAGGAFMQKLMTETRLPQAMPASGGLTMLSGFIMYWLVSDRFSSAWIVSPHGLAISLGAAAGILAAIVGGVMAKKARERMVALRGEIQGQPTPAQQAEMQALSADVRSKSRISAVLILVTLCGMALAHGL